MVYREHRHLLRRFGVVAVAVFCRHKALVFFAVVTLLWATHIQHTLEVDEADKLEKDVLVVEQFVHLVLHVFHLG